MDYQELIRLRRDESNCDVLDYVEDAATATETRLAEMEALLEQIRGKGDLCKNMKNCLNDGNARHVCAVNRRNKLEWRGSTLF